MSMATTSAPKLIPPFRFAIVEEGFYRGAYPTEHNGRFLRRLKLKTIVSLTPKKPEKVLEDYCEREGITIYHMNVAKFKDDVTLSSSQIVQILQIIIAPENMPLYIHCLDGANVTGIVIMCLRKLQNWNLSAIYSEFSRFTRESYISSAESEFVETFKAEISIPSVIPKWLWQGETVAKHPTLKLKVISDLESAKPFPVHSEKGLGSSTSSLLLTGASLSTTPSSSSSSSKKKIKDRTLLKTQFESGKYHQETDSLSRDLYALSLEGIPAQKETKTEQP
eukprot:TRINITY_DN4523_c0_g1_i2.p1 TRINITY_DN4523_c0_g1~~TRINITY_DN4523_c0_g1_i2.p1  ORF type:complete len:279 (+),score=58.81 TRINITY_DN4523_c0_g1_i2:233-1069(+)